MTRLIGFLALFAFCVSAYAQSGVPNLYINHAFVQGVYWNPDELPGWGFFVDVQELTLFGAIYGYGGGDATFITLQGSVTGLDPLVFAGDVFAISDGGSTATDVGDFIWEVRDSEAAPAAVLSLSSNILNVEDLPVARFSYTEIDKVDMLTGADWNIIRRVSDVSFGDNYWITDDRFEDEGIIYADMSDNADPSRLGVIAYFPPPDGDLYAMLIEFDEGTDAFYVFVGKDTDMFGRYWLLDEGEDPTGSGNYFHGSADTMQESNDSSGAESPGIRHATQAGMNSAGPSALRAELRRIERQLHQSETASLPQMFQGNVVREAHLKLRRRLGLPE